MYLSEELQYELLTEGISEDEFLEAYYELQEDLDTAKKTVGSKHIASDIASGFLVGGNLVQTITSGQKAKDPYYHDRLYKEYLQNCKDNHVKPMPKEDFVRRVRKFYKTRQKGKAVAMGADVLTGGATKPISAVVNHLYPRSNFE